MASNLTAPEERAWRHDILRPSLPEVHSTMPVPQSATWLRKLLAFAGPGFLVAVGYMDPGNWATDLAGGSKFNYTLLSVILLSNLMAILLQILASSWASSPAAIWRKRAATTIRRPVTFCSGSLRNRDRSVRSRGSDRLRHRAQPALRHSLVWGVCLTAVDVLVILFLQNKGFR